jgi:hypothetical protein
MPVPLCKPTSRPGGPGAISCLQGPPAVAKGRQTLLGGHLVTSAKLEISGLSENGEPESLP